MRQNLTLSDFVEYLDHAFPVTVDTERLSFVLTEATGLKPMGPGSQAPFLLIFRGPPQPLLPQRIYEIEHPRLGTLAIFIVPIGAMPAACNIRRSLPRPGAHLG